MAGRVNRKLIAILVIAFITVAVLAVGAAWYSTRRSADRYVLDGDQLKARGEWAKAAEAYSKAVFREQGNVAHLELWREALLHVVPVDESDAMERFGKITTIRHRLSEARITEAGLHRQWLQHLLDIAQHGVVSEYTTLAEAAATMLRSVAPDDPQYYLGHRYRGLANAQRMNFQKLSEQEQMQTREDLRTALQADPADAEAAIALSAWSLARAEGLVDRGLGNDAERLLDSALESAESFAQLNPDDPYGLLNLASLRKVLSARRSISGKPDLEAVGSLLARVEQLCRSGRPSDRLILLAASELAGAEDDSARGFQRALAIVDRGLALYPTSPMLLMVRARYLTVLHRRDEALTAYQTVIDLPNLPTSMDSLQLFAQRRSAVPAQFDIDMAMWDRESPDDVAPRESIRIRAQSRRALYESLTRPDHPLLLYMDGRLALAEGRFNIAADKLDKYRSTTGDQRRHVLYASAVAMLGIGQQGEAYRLFDLADQAGPGRFTAALVQMARLDAQAGRADAARSNALAVLELDPDNTDAQRIVQLMGGVGGDASVTADPVYQAMLDARAALGRTNDPQPARVILQEALARYPNEHRLYLELTLLEQADIEGDAQRALSYAQRGLELAPNNERLRIVRARLADDDLAEVLSDIIDQRASLDDLGKLLAKADLLNQYGFAAVAADLYLQAVGRAPDDPRIITREFDLALHPGATGDEPKPKPDLIRAEALAAQAARANIDQAEGLVFRGRLAMAREDRSGAIGALLEATQVKSYDGTVWRYLAEAHRMAGQFNNALRAYEESLQRREDDVTTLRGYASLQLTIGDVRGALASIRRAQHYAPNDLQIRRVYLDLEGRFGDRARIIRWRETNYRRDPDNLDNALTLAQLYMMQPDTRDKAWETLQLLSPQEARDRLSVTRLKAEWYLGVSSEKNRPIDDLIERGRSVYMTLIETQPEDAVMVQAYISMARFLRRAGESADEIATVLTEALPYQDAGNREADRALGAHYVRRGAFAQAIEHYSAALQGDPQAAGVNLTIIDLTLQLAYRAQRSGDQLEADRREAEAQRRLDSHIQLHGGGVETLLLEAAIAAGRDEIERAERIYAQGVARHPSDQRIYLKRAAFLLNLLIQEDDQSPDANAAAGHGATRSADGALIGRIESDIARAMELAPRSTDAPQLQIRLALALNDDDGLIQAHQRRIDIAPQNDEFRFEMVRLLEDRRRFDRAVALVQEAIQRRGAREAGWHLVMGDLRKKRGDQFAGYIGAYVRAYDLSLDAARPRRLIVLVRAYLDAVTPASLAASRVSQWQTDNALNALSYLDRHQELVADSPNLALLRVRALSALGRDEQAEAELVRVRLTLIALEEGLPRFNILGQWYETAGSVTPAPELQSFISSCYDTRTASLADRFLYGRLLARKLADPALSHDQQLGMTAEALRLLEHIRDDFPAPPGALDAVAAQIRGETGLLLGAVFLGRGLFPQSADAYRWTLQAYPDSVEASNNLAYVLADELGDPVSALDHAEHAYRLARRSAFAGDTYGYVLLLNGRLDDAERILREVSDRGEATAAVHLHLAQVCAAQNRIAEAEIELEEAQRLAEEENRSDLLTKIRKLRSSISDNKP